MISKITYLERILDINVRMFCLVIDLSRIAHVRVLRSTSYLRFSPWHLISQDGLPLEMQALSETTHERDVKVSEFVEESVM
jgi:hypothetical protein